MNMKKPTIILSAGFAVVLVTAVCMRAGAGDHAGHEHGGKAESKHSHGDHDAEKSAAEKTVTVTGEVLDLSCYLGHGARGKEHQECAGECLNNLHVPAGLLTADGSVFLLVPDHNSEKAFKNVGALAAEQVNVTGKKVVQGGIQGILVKSVARAEKKEPAKKK